MRKLTAAQTRIRNGAKAMRLSLYNSIADLYPFYSQLRTMSWWEAMGLKTDKQIYDKWPFKIRDYGKTWSLSCRLTPVMANNDDNRRDKSIADLTFELHWSQYQVNFLAADKFKSTRAKRHTKEMIDFLVRPRHRLILDRAYRRGDTMARKEEQKRAMTRVQSLEGYKYLVGQYPWVQRETRAQLPSHRVDPHYQGQ